MKANNQPTNNLLEWIDAANYEQAQWLHDFLVHKGIATGAFSPNVSSIDGLNYALQQGLLTLDHINEMREGWLFEREMDWVNNGDTSQAEWLHQQLANKEMLKEAYKNHPIPTHFNRELYNWPTGAERSQLVRSLRRLWKRSGLDLGWIKQSDPAQLKWFDQFMENAQLKFDNRLYHPHVLFDFAQYKWPQVKEKQLLIKEMKNDWGLEQKLSWIDPFDKIQSNWVRKYLQDNYVKPARNFPPTAQFKKAEFEWPLTHSNQIKIISEMKSAWKLKQKLEWVDAEDSGQILWVTQYFLAHGILGQTINSTLLSKPHLIPWPGNINPFVFVENMRKDWLKSGQDLDWIDQRNLKQCEHLTKYVYDRCLLNNNQPLNKRAFDIRCFDFPVGDERVKFNTRMNNAWRQKERREGSSKQTKSYELTPASINELKQLASTLNRSQQDTLEYLIHEGLRHERKLLENYKIKLFEIRMAQELKNPTPLTYIKRAKDTEKELAKVRKAYDDLLKFSELTLSKMCHDQGIIYALEASNLQLNEQQKAEVEKRVAKLKKKYLKALPIIEQTSTINEDTATLKQNDEATPPEEITAASEVTQPTSINTSIKLARRKNRTLKSTDKT